jgi:hypothetical protein
MLVRSAMVLSSVRAAQDKEAGSSSFPGVGASVPARIRRPAAPPTPTTAIRGFNSRMSGLFKLPLMACSSVGGPERPPSVAGRGQLGDDGEARDAARTTEPGPVGPAPEYLGPATR